MSLLAVALIGLLSQSSEVAGDTAPPPPSRERTLEIAGQIMKAARYASLITLGPDGQPQARVVDPTAPDSSLSVFVATNPRSRKVKEMKQDGRVTLLYFDPVRLGFVTLIARATEVRGAEKAAHYRPEWKNFFDRSAPDSYALYRIVPTRVEVVSPRDGLSGDPDTWAPAVVDLR